MVIIKYCFSSFQWLILSWTLYHVTGQPFPDWLVEDITWPSKLDVTPAGNLVLTNGIISREFSIKPGFATVDFYSHEKDVSILRAVGPEAVISLDGANYNVGGFLTGIHRAYLNRTALSEDMRQDDRTFQYVSHTTVKPIAPFSYVPGRRGAPADTTWPPKGLRLDVTFKAPSSAPDLHHEVTVVAHYEIYDGIPLITKWLTITSSDAAKGVQLNVASIENLAVNWQWGSQPYSRSWGHLVGSRVWANVYGYGWLVAETTDAHHGVAIWKIDDAVAAMPGSFEITLRGAYENPATLPISEWGGDTFRIEELVVGTSDFERLGLARKRKRRLLTPQTQENPLYFHSTVTNMTIMRSLVDQLATTGFEMLVYGFGSGFDYESMNETNIKEVADLVQYAKSRGLEMGAYDLVSLTRWPPKKWQDVPLPGYKMAGACFASGWYDYLYERMTNFMNRTGMTVLITDGPYGGFQCASTNHSYHHGLQDSVHQQTKLQGMFFKRLHERGVFITQPDDYFFQGGNRAPIGYDEMQFSLSRRQDLTISRQQLYDHTHYLIPTMTWLMVPFDLYHSSSDPDAAVFQPASKHPVDFEWALAQYLGSGVGAHYRGTYLFDTPTTRDVVRKWVKFYKDHRPIIISDIIHIRRPDVQGVDAFMHVNHRLETKALVMVFNPTDTLLTSNLTLPLYYTGLTDRALVAEQDNVQKQYTLDRHYNIRVFVELKPMGITWFVIKEAPDVFKSIYA